ncbi:MAG: ATP-binding protein [Spirochaetota bacterium]
MTETGSNRKKIMGGYLRRPKFQDVLFLLGVFLFTAVMLLSLYPRYQQDEIGRNFFLYTVMLVPLIAAIYFLVISFRSQIRKQDAEITTSIRLKIAVALIVVAILPSIPIIIISNNMINTTISELITGKTAVALEEAIEMSQESLQDDIEDMRYQLKLVRFNIIQGVYSTGYYKRQYAEFLGADNNPHYSILVGHIISSSPFRNNISFDTSTVGKKQVEDVEQLKQFLSVADLGSDVHVDRLFINGKTIIVAHTLYGKNILAMYQYISPDKTRRLTLFEKTYGNYRQQEFLKPYFQTGVGIALITISLVIIMLAAIISFVLSKSISRPAFELVDAAKQVASGDFSVKLYRSEKDEMTLLFNSFNRMVEQLEHGRRVMYQTQKLQAWRDIARKLVHEIKNPLTPIRLSAERIYRRYSEGHHDLDAIVKQGTSTIVEEVNVLMRLLSEFSRFARLPEIQPEYQSLNEIVENCVHFFKGHENIHFIINLDDSLPELYLDRGLIRQALTNLIQNAIEASNDEGDIEVHTSYIEDPDNKMAKIVIRDYGIGIEEVDISNIFEPTFSKKENGTGLGLTIVEKIIIEHGGRIYCQSEYGKGSTFTIELPV